MFTSLLKWAIVSLLIIAFIHYFYVYFKNKLTKPKIIDLASNKKIEEINTIIKNNEKKQETQQLPDKTNTMSNELSTFLNSELKNN